MTPSETLRKLAESLAKTRSNRILSRLLAELADEVERERNELINCMNERED